MEISAPSTGNNPKVVIIGGGFGGMYAARILANQPVDVTLIDRTNHHLFQPLLYQVATAMLSPADIAQPIRSILRDAKNIRVVMGRVETIDTAAKIVHTHGTQYPYHYLILAAGARHSYFGNDHWEAFAPGLKNLSDALELRRRILNAFEIAETAQDLELQEAAMTFVVIGAGPTGVEMAGSISELAKRTIVHDFRKIQTKKARVILLDAAPKVLPMFDETLAASALKQLKMLDIEVRVGTKVLGVTSDGVQLENELIRARTVVWAAGNAASPLAKQLGETDRQGRIIVSPDLSVPGHPEVFAIGDVANYSHQGGKPLPGIAPFAMQSGEAAARNIMAQALGSPTKTFKYWDKGSMATIGRNKAIADLKVVKLSGFLAWLSWLLIHLLFIVELRNRILIFFQWTWGYITYSHGARLSYRAFRPAVAPKEGSARANAEELL
ncbi:MAG TPA: NAD(P)/FAD-dependent oxidoreductase [Chthoniobacterales bacterium]|jgi:NADH dehydrogenase|nr:NAD(P)/FAD-dependent oxidoreductase [Chthoniobacterales bacterium]